MKNTVMIFLLFVTIVMNGISQEQKKEKMLIQFSGVVVDGDSLQQMPFTSIMIKNNNRGTVSDYYGYFSFVAESTDTIVFSHVGYKESMFVIPDTLTTNRYSLIQVLNKDTVELSETVIFPWPSIDEFNKAFLNLQIPEDDYIRAEQNLARAELKERAAMTPMNGSENYTNKMRQYQSRLYYAGQFPSYGILNPIAWSQFVKAWKNGELRRQ